MLFTVANALMLRNKLSTIGINSKVMTPMLLSGISEIYNRKDAIKMLEEDYIIIFGGGIGNPFVSTDYPAVQRAIEKSYFNHPAKSCYTNFLVQQLFFE